MKGLIVDSNKQLILKEGLLKPIPTTGEILIRINSASVNPYDVESAQGRFDEYFAEYGVDKEVQSGLEFSGTVESDGAVFKRGDKVFGYVDMIAGWKTHCEYIAINESYIALIPTNVTLETAAALPLGALTSLVALSEVAQLKPKQKVLINGAAGGLGVYAVQIAKLLGAHVTAFAGPGQRDFLRNIGADDVFDYNQAKLQSVKDSFDIILDLNNSMTLAGVKLHLNPNGIFIPAEPTPENGGESEDPQAGYLMVMHGDTEKLSRIASWVEKGELRIIVDRIFSFEDFQSAIARLKAKGKRGRIIMTW